MAGADRDPRKRLEIRRQPHRRAAGGAGLGRARAHRQLSESVLHDRTRAAQEYRHQEDRREASRLAGAAHRRAGARLRPDRARARARRPRPHRRAHHHRRRSHRALPPRQGPPRPARLRRPDRQDARAVRALVRRLGALQARPRHRPRADRRGAGHEPQAMGHRASTIVSEFTPGGARPNVKRTVFAVGDEKQSIFSFQGAAPLAFDEMRRALRQQFRRRRSEEWRLLPFDHSFRSGAIVLGAVDQVFRGARSLRSDHHRSGRDRASALCPTPRPAWSSCGR